MHERPASASFRDLTVVTQKSASSALRTEKNYHQTQTKQDTKKHSAERRFNQLASNVISNGPTVPIHFIYSIIVNNIIIHQRGAGVHIIKDLHSASLIAKARERWR